MNQLRPLEPHDIPQIVSLRRRVFSISSHASDDALSRYYRLLFFENPWQTDQFSSHIHEDDTGEITGFVGVIPRPMRLGSERFTAVTSTELMVAPEARGFVGPKLLRRVLDGGQQLTYSDRGNEQARALFESLGGHAITWSSLYWTVSLDGSPVAFATGSDKANMLSRVMNRAARFIQRASGPRRPNAKSDATGEPLEFDVLQSLLPKVGGRNPLIPEYTRESFDWLMSRLEQRSTSQHVVRAQVTQKGDPVGWVVYVLAGSDAEVVQLAALPGREEVVFDYLVGDATERGAALLRGRMDRRFAPLISARGYPLTLGQPWSVMQSPRSDITAQFVTGNAFFSRLDAEWWIST